MITRLTKFDELTTRDTADLSEVLARIDQSVPYLFQIVISADGKVLGTVTDGDLRRALLRGQSLQSPVPTAMRETPIVGRIGEDKANRILAQRLRFLPVVDEANRLDHILFARVAKLPLRRALVMAGGFGRRLGELTRDVPKPLLEVGGRPILDRVLEQLESAGVQLIHISTHYKAEQIESFIRARTNKAEVRTIREETPLGTAGILSCLANEIDEAVLILNGDVISQVDFGVLHDFHTRHGYDGTVAVTNHEIQIPFGVIKQTPDGQFLGIDEKPRMSHFVASGIYYLSPEFVALTPRDRPVDMPEVITTGSQAGLRIGLFPIHEYWKDVGRPADLSDAQNDYNPKS